MITEHPRKVLVFWIFVKHSGNNQEHHRTFVMDRISCFVNALQILEKVRHIFNEGMRNIFADIVLARIPTIFREFSLKFPLAFHEYSKNNIRTINTNLIVSIIVMFI